MTVFVLVAPWAAVAAATPTFTVSVATDSPPTHTVNPLYFGCHSDSGFTHQVRGFSSQMIFGESFERPQGNVSYGQAANAWSFESCAGCTASSTLLTDTVAPAMHGASSTRVVVDKGTYAALRNRGLGNEGLYLEGGKPYEGYFFARCATPVTLEARLTDYTTNDTLAMMSYDFRCGAHAHEWVRLNVSLVPKRGAPCVGIAVGSDPNVACTRPTDEAGHACVRCSAQFELRLASVGSVDFDYVVLQPGAWGRLNELPVKRSTADVLRAMGISAIRVGGSFASVTGWPDGGGFTPSSTTSGQYYQWQKWTGPPWLRPSVGAVWDAYRGNSYSLIGGWGPFEVIDMANALGIEPILTTTASSSADELADLVEYCHGDAETTPFGRRRAADGHPARYRVHFFELGNEQYNTRFVTQAAAMEARARSLGLNGTLTFIFPDNGGLRGADIDAAKRLGMDAQIAADIHVGAGGALDVARRLFRARLDFAQSAVNLETNAGTHTHARALQEATDLNSFFAAPASIQRRVRVRTASFCTSRSGHFDAFDQGIAFFLPNQTWLQPPGHVHAMVAQSLYRNALNVSVAQLLDGGAASQRGGEAAGHEGPSLGDSATESGLSVSAQRSSDGASIVVRVVNPFARPIGPAGEHSLSLAVALGVRTTCTACALSVLASTDPNAANPAYDISRVAPQPGGCTLDARGARIPSLSPLSYNVLTLSGCSTRKPSPVGPSATEPVVQTAIQRGGDSATVPSMSPSDFGFWGSAALSGGPKDAGCSGANVRTGGPGQVSHVYLDHPLLAPGYAVAAVQLSFRYVAGYTPPAGRVVSAPTVALLLTDQAGATLATLATSTPLGNYSFDHFTGYSPPVTLAAHGLHVPNDQLLLLTLEVSNHGRNLQLAVDDLRQGWNVSVVWSKH